jgi:predicted peroxiredoxin
VISVQNSVVNENLIFKIHGKHPIIKKLFQVYGEFLPHVYRLIGVNVYIETTIDGAVIFFESLEDFVKFHQLSEAITLPPLPEEAMPSKKDQVVEMIVDNVHRPQGITPDELVEGVAKCYGIMSKDIEVEKISEDRAIIRYRSVRVIEQSLEMLQKIWDQKEKIEPFEPNSKFIANAFNFSRPSP